MRILSVLSVIFALAAAALWGLSATVSLPVLKSGFGTLISQMKDGTTVVGEAPFYAAMAKISALNAWAASCAAVSAVMQAITLFRRQ